jgi:large subunit ribosomal protein L32
MPNPKRRHSHARTRTRRAHDALKTPQFYTDKDSGEAKVPHRIDAKTGTYKVFRVYGVVEFLVNSKRSTPRYEPLYTNKLYKLDN